MIWYNIILYNIHNVTKHNMIALCGLSHALPGQDLIRHVWSSTDYTYTHNCRYTYNSTIHLSLYNIHIYIHTWVYMNKSTNVYIYIYIYTSLSIYIYTHMYIQVCVYIYIYIYICIRVCIYIYIYMYICTYMCIYMFVYIYIYIYRERERERHMYIYIYIHIHMSGQDLRRYVVAVEGLTAS